MSLVMDLSKIEKFIDRQRVSFICSVDSEGFPNVRAMLKPRKRISLRKFYFSTNTSSAKVQQYRHNSKASIYFYHKGLIKYTGVMHYKEGKTDPNYCVLKFIAESGRYYLDLRTKDFKV